jgi:chromosomal replication initiator protein
MRAAILLKKAHNEKINIELTEDMALYIAGNIDSNVRDLEGALLKQCLATSFCISLISTSTACGLIKSPRAVSITSLVIIRI